MEEESVEKKPRERTDWDDLYDYVQFNIFEYPKEIQLSKYMVGRLHGLNQGRFVGAKMKDKKPLANYPYKVILNTFKLCSQRIKSALRTKQFDNETIKCNYIMSIIESNINDMYMRMENTRVAEEQKKTMDKSISMNTDLSSIYEKRAEEAKTKPQTKRKNRYSNLW